MADLLVNVDVPDLLAAVAFYTTAFGLTVSRRIGAEAAELAGWPAKLYLLEKPDGSVAAATEPRRYTRHWTPVHLDIVVDDLAAALERAIRAGARLERGPRADVWGTIAVLADPFGHGFCLTNSGGAATTRSQARPLRHERGRDERRGRAHRHAPWF